MKQMGHFYQVMYHSSGGLRAPPVKSVADFLMYLFQDRKLQPSTIDDYRSGTSSWFFAPADKVHFEPIKGLLEAFDLQGSFPLGPGVGQA